MGLAEFFNRSQTSQEVLPQRNQCSDNKTTGNANIDAFCKKFFEKAGPNYHNTLPEFIKLVFTNRSLLQEILNSPEIKQIESMANSAVSKGIINKETIDGFSNVLNLFKQ